jgi:hypothetical protein
MVTVTYRKSGAAGSVCFSKKSMPASLCWSLAYGVFPSWVGIKSDDLKSRS